MSIFTSIKTTIRETITISERIDKAAATDTIRKAMVFRGPNVWILAFSIVIASVGLNLNSIPVIIGAMLISPLMGPIYAIGLGLGTNDTGLLKEALKHLGIMVLIALIASMLYFLLTPLNFANPTELEARTNPSIYDVIIALFGGLAGILEICRNKSGTVIAGVAIATALMPPLCTAGYGLAHLNAHFFFGAFFLFSINLVFIALATYVTVKYLLGFPEASYVDEKIAKRAKRIITGVVIVIMVPSIWSAVNLIRYNNFEQRVSEFVKAGKNLDGVYIYDSHTEWKNGGIATIHIAGEALKAETKAALISSAESFGLYENQLIIREHIFANDDNDNSEVILKGIYERTDAEINKREIQIRQLETELNSLREQEIPYVQITKEVQAQYPQVLEIGISKGASVEADSLQVNRQMVVLARTRQPLSSDNLEKLTNWFKIRLNDTTVVIINQKPNAK